MTSTPTSSPDSKPSSAKATQAQLARELGVSRQSVNELIKRGLLTTDEDGLIDVDQARRELETTLTRPDSKILAAVLPAQPQPESATAPPDPETPPETTDSSYHAARTLREIYEAKLRRLKYLVESGSLVDREEVARLRFTEFRALRDALNNIGPRLKDQLAAETDPMRCEAIVAAELEETLEAFATEVLTRGVTNDADDDDPD